MFEKYNPFFNSRAVFENMYKSLSLHTFKSHEFREKMLRWGLHSQLLCMLLCSVLIFQIVTAQGNASSMFGLVTDNHGRALLLANVTVTHIPSGTLYVTTTREDGQFHLSGLRPGGTYSIKVSYVGFKEQERRSVHLEPQQSSKVDFSLVEETIHGTVTKEIKTKAIKNRGSSKRKYN